MCAREEGAGGGGAAGVAAHSGVRLAGSCTFTSLPTAMRSSHASRSLHLIRSIGNQFVSLGHWRHVIAVGRSEDA